MDNMKKRSDGELVLKLRDGDEEAFNELYRRFYRLVYYIAFELCRNEADAQDVMQEVFVSVKKSIHLLNEPDKFKSWLNRITVNKCKNLFRNNKIKLMSEDDVFFKNSAIEERKYMLPEKNMHFENDKDLLHYFVNKLPEGQRIVIFLRFFQDMSMQELSDTLELPIGTVKTRLLYGKANLKKMIETYERTSNIRVSFQVNDVCLVALFAYCFKHTTFPIVKGGRPTSFHALTALISTSAIKALLIGGVVVGIGISAIMIKENLELAQNARLEDSAIKLEQSKAKEYYFALLEWASSEEEMKTKDKEDFESIMHIYNELKDTNSKYYSGLMEQGWVAVFEQIYNSF